MPSAARIQVVAHRGCCSIGKVAHWAIICDTARVTATGLRDAKREATTRALAQAAFDLARERGVDGFTIGDVADQAGYSRRTFANHFPDKEAAIVAVAAEQVRHALDAVPDDDLPLLDWLHAVARQQLAGGLLGVLRELRSMAVEHPSLRPALCELQQQVQDAARAAVLTRLGSEASPITQLHAQLLVGAAYGALSSVLTGQFPARELLAGGAPEAADETAAASVDALLTTMFALLRRGFGQVLEEDLQTGRGARHHV